MQVPVYVGDAPDAKPDRLRRRGKVGADGTVVVEVGAPAGGEYWWVNRMVVQAVAAPAGTCRAYTYVGEIQASDLEDVSNDASFDVADNQVPILVDNEPLLVLFAGAPAGSDVYVTTAITRVRT